MKKQNLKTIFADGVALGIPLAVIIYLLEKVLKTFQKIMGPIAVRMGIERLFGEITLLILALLAMFICIMLLGIAMRWSIVSKWRSEVEGILLKIFPPLQQLKAMLYERMERESASEAWKPVILEHGNKYEPAFLVDENADTANFFVIKGPTVQDGQTLVVKRDSIRYKSISAKELRDWVRHNGKDALRLTKI